MKSTSAGRIDCRLEQIWYVPPVAFDRPAARGPHRRPGAGSAREIVSGAAHDRSSWRASLLWMADALLRNRKVRQKQRTAQGGMGRPTISGLHKFYGSTHAVRGVDLDMPEGEFAVLVGTSACGKSTLLRAIAWFRGQVR